MFREKNQNFKVVGIWLFFAYVAYFAYYLTNKNILASTYMQLSSFGFEWLLGESYGYIWGYSFLNLTFSTVVFWIVNFPSFFKILRNDFLVNLGKFSFSIYLFHVPILEFSYYLKNNGFIHNKFQMGIIFSALTYLFGFLSWHLVEKKFLQMKSKI